MMKNGYTVEDGDCPDVGLLAALQTPEPPETVHVAVVGQQKLCPGQGVCCALPISMQIDPLGFTWRM